MILARCMLCAVWIRLPADRKRPQKKNEMHHKVYVIWIVRTPQTAWKRRKHAEENGREEVFTRSSKSGADPGNFPAENHLEEFLLDTSEKAIPRHI